MPTYLITAPDGRKFNVSGPGTQEEALAHIQSTYQPPRNLKAENPGEYDASSPEFQAKYGPTSASSFGQNMVEGVGKSMVDTGRGVQQLGVEVGDKLGVVNQTSQDLIRGESPTDRVRRQASEVAQQDAPLMHTGGGVTGYIGGQIAQAAIPGGALGRAATLGGRLAQGAGAGAALANTQPVTSEQTRLGATALGATGGAVGEGIASGIGKLASASSKITPEVRALAEKAQELGIPLRAEQLSKSRPLAGVSAALDAIPLSGRDASREVQRAAFNRAVAKTFGEDTDNVATAVKQGTARLGAKYDAVLRNNPVKADDTFVNELSDVVQAARGELTDQQFGVIARQADDILSKVGAGDKIDAQAAYNIKKTLDRISKSQDTSLGHHAGELKDVVLSALDRSLPEDVASSFAQTRKQYANLISVRRLVKAGAEGNVTPASLGNVKNLRGDLKDVADVGAQFLKEPFGNSGTQNRLIGASILGGAGVASVVNPASLVSIGASLAAGRTANKILQSRIAIKYLLKGSPAAQKLLSSTRHVLPLAGAAVAGE